MPANNKLPLGYEPGEAFSFQAKKRAPPGFGDALCGAWSLVLCGAVGEEATVLAGPDHLLRLALELTDPLAGDAHLVT